jgi:hypothetical protein
MDLTVPRIRRGRKLSDPARTFCARLLADVRGITEQHAAELLKASDDAAPPHLWQMARTAVEDGASTIPHFDSWLMGEIRRRLS